MQFMYLRRVNKKSAKNPGRHPIGMVGVKLLADGKLSVAVQMVHSSDRFERSIGRKLLEKKLDKDRTSLLTNSKDVPFLHAILPVGTASRLDDYNRHQEIFAKLVQDEFTGGSWSKQK